MLVALRHHLRSVGASALSQIAAHLHVEPAAAEGLLDVLVRRGDAIREPVAGGPCGQCSGSCGRGRCGPQDLVVYRAARGG